MSMADNDTTTDLERAQNTNSDMRYDAGIHAGRK